MLCIGTAGSPISTSKPGTLEAIKRVRELGLDAMELEFVRGVYVKTEEKAREIKECAEENNIKLSVHAPYFINLNSEEKIKIKQSMERIINSAEVAHNCGARSVVIHSAFYGKNNGDIYNTVKERYEEMGDELLNLGIKDVNLRPELMGKHSQFGSLEEIVQLSKEIKCVKPCVDFGHYIARYSEKNNNYESFSSVFEHIRKELGEIELKDMHIHFSDIEFTEKGERKHLVFDEGPLKWKEMVKAWKDYKIEGIAICESPNIETDALKAKKEYLN
jgi:deoxyribonuclease IV